MWVIERHATGDFETYSEAGFRWDANGQKWTGPPGTTKKGLSVVGSAAYAEHPSTEVLTFSYALPGDNYPTRWRPGQPNPTRLFDWLAAGGLLEAHNVMFERLIWHHVCRPRYGWPDLPVKQLRCSMAKARVNSLPGGLDDLVKVLKTTIQKDEDGKRLINLYSVPQKPTKKNPATRLLLADNPVDDEKMASYCDVDVLAEQQASDAIMPMTADELEFWQFTEQMNWRGLGIDHVSVSNMVEVMEQTLDRYGEEYKLITGGIGPSQLEKSKGWLLANSVSLEKMDDKHITETLTRKDLSAPVRRVLELRQLVGSAAVKKLYAMERSQNNRHRVQNTIIHHGARTGRPTGELLQPLNLVKRGPDLVYCEACNAPSKFPPIVCPWCATPMSPLLKRYKWPDTPEGWEGNPVDYIQQAMATRSLDAVEYYFGDAFLAIAGCLRGMIVADDGNDLIASDYSAIEAVVTAMLAGEQWRIDTFRRKEDIYVASASQITGRSMEFYAEYKKANGAAHPDRQKIGKVAELGLGFGGWLTAWRKFDSTDNFTDDEVKQKILAWRAASPRVVEMWGGQERGRPWEPGYRLERYGFEGCFINAVQYPRHAFEYAGIRFYTRKDALIIRLLSGRELTYHSPRLHQSTRDYVGPGVLEITYMTWNNNPLYGPPGWGPMKTYSSKITENIVQAVAHDIQRYGMLALEAVGYTMILGIYDEDIAEIPQGWGSLEEFERIMSTMPPWAADWPIRASGGWRGRRYRKA